MQYLQQIKIYVIIRIEFFLQDKQKNSGFSLVSNMKGGVLMDKQTMKNLAAEAHERLIGGISEKNGAVSSELAEEYAFFWFSRLIAVRYMQANGFDVGNGIFQAAVTESNDIWAAKFLDVCRRNKNVSAFFPDDEKYIIPSGLTGENGLVCAVLNEISDDVFCGNVQVIGWLYQFFNSSTKSMVYSELKNNVKISPEKIPAATQIFTPDWIVQYMVENTLGKLWNDCGGGLGFEYCADFAESGNPGKRSPESITFIDPCMGCGNILVYAFDVFMRIYRSCGYSDDEAVRFILTKNLFGLDIDRRSYRLAVFSLLMKAAEYSPSVLNSGISLNLAEFSSAAEKCRSSGGGYNDVSQYCDIYGSLLHGGDMDFPYAEKIDRILSGKYDIVVTNPPYMSSSNMNGRLLAYVRENYFDYRADLFSAFVTRCSDFTKKDGYSGFLTPYVWMFIQSYEKLRRTLIETHTIRTLVQFEYSSFRDATVPLCMFTMKKDGLCGKGKYIRLSEFRGDMEIQRIKTLEALKNDDCGYVYKASPKNFMKMPNVPTAYWISERVAELYEKYQPLSDFAAPRKGNSTSDNDRFLRYWYEVDINRLNTGCTELKRENTLEKYWFPYNKGGGFRKWYGFNSYVINWYDDAAEIRAIPTSVIANYKYFMKAGLTWSTLTSGNFSIRWFDEGWIFDNGGCCIFELGEKREYICALLNSKVFSSIFGQLNPTLNFQSGDVAKFPIVYKPDIKIDRLVHECVQISKDEYDSFETSRDFRKHPLIP